MNYSNLRITQRTVSVVSVVKVNNQPVVGVSKSTILSNDAVIQ